MNKVSKDELFVISAPSAGGKTTIIKRLISMLNGSLKRVITCTTRENREGEIDGVDYKFLSMDEFKKHLEMGDFAESATVYGNNYGVLKKDLLAPGMKVISLDSKGVKNFRSLNIPGTYILITPPSLEVLRDRMLSRGTEKEEDILIRLAEAKKELEQADMYDHLIVNDDLDNAVLAFKKIITGVEENEKT